MTVYEDEIPARRRGVGTKVLVLACAILAILGSFWSIVWFIRTYVEPPRVLMPAGLSLTSRDSKPAQPPTATMRRIGAEPAEPKSAPEAKPAEAEPRVGAPQPDAPSVRAFSVREPTDQSSASAAPAGQAANAANAVADRWGSLGPAAAPPPPAPAPSPAPTVTATAPPDPPLPSFMTIEKDTDEVVERSVPTIAGPAPLPRRRPVVTAQRRNVEPPPLPRPRPDGQVAPPPSVFTAVPPPDDRYPGQ